MNRRTPKALQILASTVAPLFLALYAAGQSAGTSDFWSLIRIGDQAVGYFRETARPSVDGRTVTAIDSVVALNRLGDKVEIIQKAEIEESADGSLLKISGHISSSKQTTLIEALVKEGVIELQTSAGGKTYSRTLPFAGRLIGPQGARQLTAGQLKNPGARISYQTFSPELANVVEIARQALERETIQLPGQSLNVIKAEERLKGLPIKRTIWIDGEGRVVRQSEPGPFGMMEIVRSDRATSLGAAGGAALPEEMYDRTLARSNIRLPHPRSLESVRIRITHRKPELGWPDLGGENQTVLAQARDQVMLEIRRPRLKSSRPVYSLDRQDPYLQPNAVLQSDDTEVQRIAREVVGEEKDLLKAARKLQAWVAQNLKLDLGIALAPASEVARNRKGTCLAYSALLASLERAAGIRSRVAMGFVYVGGIWGGHAWTEILVGDQWIPIDAAVFTPGIADAARLKFVAGSFEAGMGAESAAMGQMYGNVDIAILEYTVNGQRVAVAETQKPFLVDGDVYRNPWLGFTIRKPRGFQFTALNEVWPSATVVGMSGSHGEQVRLLQKSVNAGVRARLPEAYLEDLGISGHLARRQIGGYSAVEVSAPEKAGLAFVDDTTVWVLLAEGVNAPKLLNEVASGWKAVKK
jgi:Transglutaminase-like superfamily